VISALLAACEPDVLTGLDDESEVDSGEAPPAPPRDAGMNDTGAIAPPPLPDAAVNDLGFPVPDAGFEMDAGDPPASDAGDPNRECYTEPFDPTVSLADLEQSYNGGNACQVLIEALARRYPAAADLLIEEQNDPYTCSFIDASSFATVMVSGMTEAHEATHGWDYGHSLFYEHFDYYLRSDLSHSLSFDVDGFPRSEIYGMVEDDSTDLYRGTYLTGEQGTRGLLELLDETNCYINGLGAMAALGEYEPFGISGRDGAVAFLYYVALYLRRARVDHPQLYATMLQDAALKEHVKIQWLRTHFFLMFADMIPEIGIHDGEIRDLLYQSHNIGEISMLIGRCVDQTNCLCD
jgi:hypothetical protein